MRAAPMAYLSDLGIAEFDEFILQELQLIILHVFDVDERIARRVDRLNKLIELEVNRARVAVLRILDEEDHEEGEDGRTGVHEELPFLGIMEERARERPKKDERDGRHECPRRAHERTDQLREFSEKVVHASSIGPRRSQQRGGCALC